MDAKRSAVVVSLITMVLGAVLVGAGFHFRGKEKAGVASVSIEDVIDRARVPAGRFVSVSGSVGPTRRTYDDSTVFALREQPGLVLVCSGSESECGAASLEKQRTFTGRVYDGGDYAGSPGIPGLAVDQFSKEDLAQRGQEAVRVLNLAETPASDATNAVIAFAFGGLLLALGAVLVALVAAGVLPRPPRTAAR